MICIICIMSDNNYIVYAGTLPADDFDGNYIKYKAFTDLTDAYNQCKSWAGKLIQFCNNEGPYNSIITNVQLFKLEQLEKKIMNNEDVEALFYEHLYENNIPYQINWHESQFYNWLNDGYNSIFKLLLNWEAKLNFDNGNLEKYDINRTVSTTTDEISWVLSNTYKSCKDIYDFYDSTE